MSHPFFKPLSFLPFLSFYLLFLHSALGADPISLQPVQSNCSGGGYAKGSAFETNLNTLFSSLNSKSPTTKFYNDSAGTGGDDRVYGLFLCQGDLSSTECQACIKAATANVTTACSQRQAVIYYDYCHLRYSDRDFFGIMDPDGVPLRNGDNASDPERVLDFVSNLVKEAPFQRPLMFAANASLRHHLFAMAECTMDITSADCAKCLNKIFGAIKSCCSGQKGWRFLSPSCIIRYEAVSFLRNITTSEIVESQCSGNKLPSGDVNLQQNLNSLLSSLPNQARAGGFYNTTVGGDPDRLYGLALCRPDLAPGSEACLNCLEDAAADAADDCPNNTQAIVWHEKCLLRYSNLNFFGVVNNDMKILCNPQQNSEAGDAAVIQMMTSLVDRAAGGQKLFAADEGTAGNDPSYGLMQCTRDLSSEGCRDCLTEAMGNVTVQCMQKKGWRVLSGSCTARYESYPFFNASILAADAPAPAPAPSGKGNATGAPAPTVKGGSGVFRPNFMTMALLCLLLINSMAGLPR